MRCPAQPSSVSGSRWNHVVRSARANISTSLNRRTEATWPVSSDQTRQLAVSALVCRPAAPRLAWTVLVGPSTVARFCLAVAHDDDLASGCLTATVFGEKDSAGYPPSVEWLSFCRPQPASSTEDSSISPMSPVPPGQTHQVRRGLSMALISVGHPGLDVLGVRDRSPSMALFAALFGQPYSMSPR